MEDVDLKYAGVGIRWLKEVRTLMADIILGSMQIPSTVQTGAGTGADVNTARRGLMAGQGNKLQATDLLVYDPVGILQNIRSRCEQKLIDNVSKILTEAGVFLQTFDSEDVDEAVTFHCQYVSFRMVKKGG